MYECFIESVPLLKSLEVSSVVLGFLDCLQQRRCTFHYRVDLAASDLNLAIQLPSQLIMGNLIMVTLTNK